MDKQQKELSARVLDYFFDSINPLHFDEVSKMEHKKNYVTIPFMFEGVLDMLRFNFTENRFDKIIMTVVADENPATIHWSDEPVYLSDTIKFVEVDIPIERE